MHDVSRLQILAVVISVVTPFSAATAAEQSATSGARDASDAASSDASRAAAQVVCGRLTHTVGDILSPAGTVMEPVVSGTPARVSTSKYTATYMLTVTRHRACSFGKNKYSLNLVCISAVKLDKIHEIMSKR